MLRAGAIATGVAVVAVIVIMVLARALGADLDVPMGPDSTELVPLSTVFSAVLTFGLGVAATGFAWLLERVVPSRSATIFAIVSALILLVSFVPVFALGLATADIVWLSVLHVVVAAAIAMPLLRVLRAG